MRDETVANLVLVMDHVVTYFGPIECLSKQKHCTRYKIEKSLKLTTRQYVELVRDINLIMAQMPPLTNDNQQLDESEIVDLLANKTPRINKSMMISQAKNRRPFNPCITLRTG